MSEPRSYTRRTAFAGLGAGGLSIALAGRMAATPPNRDQGTAGGAFSLESHPLNGLWLAMVELPSNPGVTMAVPSIYNAGGFVMLSFPVTEVRGNGIHLKGTAIGTWQAIDDHAAHFTVVQVLSDAEGGYQGSLTIDGYPSVDEHGSLFQCDSEHEVLTIRDANNVVVSVEQGLSGMSMLGYRMTPGHAGFPEAAHRLDRRSTD